MERWVMLLGEEEADRDEGRKEVTELDRYRCWQTIPVGIETEREPAWTLYGVANREIEVLDEEPVQARRKGCFQPRAAVVESWGPPTMTGHWEDDERSLKDLEWSVFAFQGHLEILGRDSTWRQ
jgi:hypothetical protein